MKRILLLCLSLIMLASSCQKSSTWLSGTEWELNDGSVQLSFTKIQAVFTFPGGVSSYYSYEYNDPTVIMYPEDNDKASLKGIISDDNMSVVNLSTSKTIGIFTRK